MQPDNNPETLEHRTQNTEPRMQNRDRAGLSSLVLRLSSLVGRSSPSGPRTAVTRLFLPGTLLLVVLLCIAGAYYAWMNLAPKPPAKPDSTWTRILDTGVFRIGIDPSFPPFETDDGKGHLSGLDIALANELIQTWSTQSGVTLRVQYVYSGYDGLYDALKASQFDAILSALPYNPSKTEDVRFSHSYFNGGPQVVVREDSNAVNNWQDLADKRIGVELGSSGDTFARRWQRRLKYDLIEFNTPAEALHAVKTGQVDGVFADAIAFDVFLKSEGGVKTVGKPLADELYVIAVRKDAFTLLQQINAVVDGMKDDGRMDQLYAQWLTVGSQ
jgi:ABC-type amino acid transport substrate-binding protein